jgi:F-type H+-transporting ATPase subunit c
MSLKSKLSVIVAVATALVLVPAMAFAQEAGANKWDSNKWAAASAGFAIGIAALGGTLGQSRAASSALEGISRNPGAAARIQTPMILGLALIESLVLFAWVIAFLLLGKIAA